MNNATAKRHGLDRMLPRGVVRHAGEALRQCVMKCPCPGCGLRWPVQPLLPEACQIQSKSMLCRYEPKRNRVRLALSLLCERLQAAGGFAFPAQRLRSTA